MRLKLAMAPWWIQGLVMGTFFGACMTVFFVITAEHPRWWAVLTGGAVAGVLFGVPMALVVSRLNRAFVDQISGHSVSDRQLIWAATQRRGPVPGDPVLRRAALSLLERQRATFERTRGFALWFFPLLMALYVWLAVSQSPWWILGIVVFAWFWTLTLLGRKRFEERSEALRDRPVLPEVASTTPPQPFGSADPPV